MVRKLQDCQKLAYTHDTPHVKKRTKMPLSAQVQQQVGPTGFIGLYTRRLDPTGETKAYFFFFFFF